MNLNIKTEEQHNPVPGVSVIRNLMVKTPKSFEVNELVIKPGEKTPVDQHEVAEFFYIQSGHGTLRYDNEDHPIHPGMWFHFHPMEKHQVICASDSPLHILSLYWKAS